jgi:hypothetical protein
MHDTDRNEHVPKLHVAWSSIYRSPWDARPEEYVSAGLVGWGRSRRLAKIQDSARAFKSYLGVQCFDPTRWNLPGDPSIKFFASFFVDGRTAGLRTYPTIGEALAAVRAFHAELTMPLTTVGEE